MSVPTGPWVPERASFRWRMGGVLVYGGMLLMVVGALLLVLFSGR